MSDRTNEVITALEPHARLISKAIGFRADSQERQESAVRAFVKNNAAELGIVNAKRLCVDWERVIEHYKTGS